MLAQGTTWQTATTINSGETKEGSLYSYERSERNDEWYKIVVPEEGTATFTVTPGGSLDIYWIRIYRVKDGELVQRNNSGVGKVETVFPITDLGIGTYYINIHRYSGSGSYSLKYNFTPCPIGNDPEPNDEYGKASLLTSGKTIGCRLGYTDDTGLTDDDDWFRIEVPDEGKIEFTLNPNQDNALNIYWIRVYRLNEKGELVQRNNSGVGKEEEVITITDLGIGTFYVNVHRYSGHGGYTLKYEFTPVNFVGDEEPNDEWSQGSLLKSGETLECKLGYTDDKGETDNDDWFKIIVPEEGTVKLTLNPSQENALDIYWVRLYRVNENGEIVQRNNSGVGKEETAFPITDVGIGTYYVNVHRYSGHGGYTLKYEFIPCPLGNDPEPNNEFAEGSLLTSGKTIDCRLGYTDDTGLTDDDDWFKIVAPEEGTVELTLNPSQENALDIYWVRLYRVNESGELVQRNNSGVGKEEKIFPITDVGKGTFYVNVHRYSGHGGYTLKYEFTSCPIDNDPEPNDKYDKGSLLTSGETIGCRLGYTDDTGLTDDDDWFKIEVEKDGKAEFTLNPNQENKLDIYWVRLYRVNENGELVQRNNTGVGKVETVFPITDVGKGTFYVNVHRYSGHGGYTLKYVFTPNPYIGDEEPNDSYEQAQTLVKGEKIMAHLGYTDDTGTTDNDDWYKFDVDIIGTPNLTIVPNQTYELDVYWIRVYSLNDGELHQIKNSGVGKYQAGIYLPYYDKGTYYVNVHRYSGHGGYTLLYDEEPIRYFDDEPNDDFAQAVIINDGETKVGNIGFKKDEETYDIDDWFKVSVDEGSQLIFSYDPDQGEGVDATLILYYYENGDLTPVTVKYNQGSLKSGTSAWAHLQSLNIMTDENMKGGTYYLQLRRNNGMGTYTMTFNTARRSLGSDIRVNYIGWPSVRKGVPGSFDVTVENTGSMPTAPFLLCIPYTEDIKLLYANLPNKNGGQRVDVSDMGDEQYHNAIFVFPGMNPYEKYTFTVWAEGYVEGTYDARAMAKIQPTPVSLTILGLMAVNFITEGANGITEDNLKKGFTNYVKTYAQEEDVLEEFERAYGVAEGDLRKQKSESTLYAQGFTTILAKASESVNSGLDYAETVKEAIEYLKTIACPLRSIFMEKFGIYDECSGTLKTIEILDEEVGANNIVTSWDPNEMVGPAGYGDENYIGDVKTINYRILFENKAEAEAPAYRIRITDVLDENVFDVESVRFGETSHDAGTGWKMTRDGNKLSWDIEGIELPPNVNAPEGEGYVTFTVNLKSGLQNLTKIKNMATIIFDKNDPIETNEYVNTLDLKLPEASMTGASYSGSSVRLKSKGTDAESGISRYKFYAAKGDGEFELIGESNTEELTYKLPAGANAEDYKFAVAAVDNAGNTQGTLSEAIAATKAASADLNGDGKINGTDIQVLINAIVDEEEDDRFDINGDGKVNGTDIQTLINIILEEE
jgi:hypothetical protein